MTKHYINTYPETNTIDFNGPIESETCSNLIKELCKMEQDILRKTKKLKRKWDNFISDDSDFEDYNIQIEEKHITLNITSNGGIIMQAFSVCDTIKNLRVPVYTVCKGKVASAGTLISVYGTRRYITSNSYMLIHQLSHGVHGTYEIIKQVYENDSELMEHLKRIYLEKTKMTREFIDEQFKNDDYWNASKCLSTGLVDEII